MVRLMVVVKCFSVPYLHLFFAVYIIKISILKFSFVFMFSAWFPCGDNSEKITKTNRQEVDQNPKPEWQIAWWWAACCVVWEAFWYLLVELIIDVGLKNNFTKFFKNQNIRMKFKNASKVTSNLIFTLTWYCSLLKVPLSFIFDK